MVWWGILLLLLAAFVFYLSFLKGKKTKHDEVEDTYICDQCGKHQCECHKVDSHKDVNDPRP